MLTASRSVKVGKAKPSAAKRSSLGFSKKTLAIAGAAVLALGAIYWTNADSAAGKFKFQVGSPGPGETAPPIRLSSAELGSFDLSAQRGKTVLLYFQEGIMCQPCWEQIRDIEKNIDSFRSLGVEEIVSITTDPANFLRQKKDAERLSTPVFSDPDLAVSKAYSTNLYGMMGDSMNGHSFILIGPDGNIEWRADYGGAPDYTMFVPAENLLADLQRGLAKG